jgi:hypothetical protein
LWLGGNPIRWVKTTKILGMTLDDNMKCKDHVEELVLNYAKEVNSPEADAFSSMRHACLYKDFYWKVVYGNPWYRVMGN